MLVCLDVSGQDCGWAPHLCLDVSGQDFGWSLHLCVGSRLTECGKIFPQNLCICWCTVPLLKMYVLRVYAYLITVN